MPSRLRHFPVLLLTVAMLLTSACSTVSAPDKHDPWESFNRSVYTFNDGFDRHIGRPVAQAYRDYTPNTVQTGVNNFFNNLNDVVVFANDLLQFKFEQAAQDFSRLAFNTTVGLLGLIDVSTPMGLPKHNEDFGQTMATWGVGNGPYLVLPFLGPSTVRDASGMVADWEVQPVSSISDNTTRWSLIILYAIDTRASLLEATKLMEKSGIDPYVFMRNAYYQHRESLIYDGNPPKPKIAPPSKSDLELQQELDKELQLDTPTK